MELFIMLTFGFVVSVCVFVCIMSMEHTSCIKDTPGLRDADHGVQDYSDWGKMIPHCLKQFKSYWTFVIELPISMSPKLQSTLIYFFSQNCGHPECFLLLLLPSLLVFLYGG